VQRAIFVVDQTCAVDGLMTARSDKPFARWRAHGYREDPHGGEDRIDHMADNGAVPFDECVVALTREACVHIEVMGDRDLFVGIGDVIMSVHVAKDGTVETKLIEGKCDEATGIIR
jgi:hypothetical protein